MSLVEFEENNSDMLMSRQILGEPTEPGMALWLQKTGIIKNEKTAYYIFVAIILLCFLASGVILYKTFKNQEPTSTVIRQLSG